MRGFGNVYETRNARLLNRCRTTPHWLMVSTLKLAHRNNQLLSEINSLMEKGKRKGKNVVALLKMQILFHHFRSVRFNILRNKRERRKPENVNAKPDKIVRNNL